MGAGECCAPREKFVHLGPVGPVGPATNARPTTTTKMTTTTMLTTTTTTKEPQYNWVVTSS